LTCPLVAVVSAVAVSLAAAVALSSRQPRSFACRDAFEIRTQRLYKNENTSVVTSEMNDEQ
jgi:hypothetical protein